MLAGLRLPQEEGDVRAAHHWREWSVDASASFVALRGKTILG